MPARRGCRKNRKKRNSRPEAMLLPGGSIYTRREAADQTIIRVSSAI